MAIQDEKKREELNKIGLIFLGYAVLCFITSFWFNSDVGKTALQEQVSPQGGTIGPLHVEESNAVYLITVQQNVQSMAWSFVNGDVLDENKNYLFGFGGEFWEEQGRDSDGAWREAKENFDLKVTFPKPGKFYLKFESEMKTPDSGQGINIVVKKKRGSSLAHFILGLFSIIAAVGILFYANSEKSTVR